MKQENRTNGSELDFQSQNVNESIDCLMQHLKVLLIQASNKEIADFGEPCSKCMYLEQCGANWIKKIEPLETMTQVRINLGCLEQFGQ